MNTHQNKIISLVILGFLFTISPVAKAALILDLVRDSDTTATFTASGVLDVAVPQDDVRIAMDNIFATTPANRRNDSVSSYDGSLQLGGSAYSFMYTLANWNDLNIDTLYWFSVSPTIGDVFSGSFTITLPTGYTFVESGSVGNISFGVGVTAVETRTFIGSWNMDGGSNSVSAPATLGIVGLVLILFARIRSRS